MNTELISQSGEGVGPMAFYNAEFNHHACTGRQHCYLFVLPWIQCSRHAQKPSFFRWSLLYPPEEVKQVAMSCK